MAFNSFTVERCLGCLGGFVPALLQVPVEAEPTCQSPLGMEGSLLCSKQSAYRTQSFLACLPYSKHFAGENIVFQGLISLGGNSG